MFSADHAIQFFCISKFALEDLPGDSYNFRRGFVFPSLGYHLCSCIAYLLISMMDSMLKFHKYRAAFDWFITSENTEEIR